jgi:fido (protein-threonine AMPylation protein)
MKDNFLQGIGQADFKDIPVVEIRCHIAAIHPFRSGGQA